MTDIDYDDESNLTEWLQTQRTNVKRYLAESGVKHGGVLEVGWCLAPYVSVWPVRSGVASDKIGFWAISGDLPTDYLSGHDAVDPREATRAFADRWEEFSKYMLRGEEHPDMTVGNLENRIELGELLSARAKMLKEWSLDEGIWGV
jgi:hypothetical protein